MLALPYLFERGFKGSRAMLSLCALSSLAFEGNVYATSPTIAAARQMFTDIVYYLEGVSVHDYGDDAWQKRTLLRNLPALMQQLFARAPK
jgi:hypothetical protein